MTKYIKRISIFAAFIILLVLVAVRWLAQPPKAGESFTLNHEAAQQVTDLVSLLALEDGGYRYDLPHLPDDLYATYFYAGYLDTVGYDYGGLPNLSGLRPSSPRLFDGWMYYTLAGQNADTSTEAHTLLQELLSSGELAFDDESAPYIYDMNRVLSFYRQLGLELPADAADSIYNRVAALLAAQNEEDPGGFFSNVSFALTLAYENPELSGLAALVDEETVQHYEQLLRAEMRNSSVHLSALYDYLWVMTHFDLTPGITDARILAYLNACRHANGGFSPMPGYSPTPDGAYHAANIIIRMRIPRTQFDLEATTNYVLTQRSNTGNFVWPYESTSHPLPTYLAHEVLKYCGVQDTVRLNQYLVSLPPEESSMYLLFLQDIAGMPVNTDEVVLLLQEYADSGDFYKGFAKLELLYHTLELAPHHGIPTDLKQSLITGLTESFLNNNTPERYAMLLCLNRLGVAKYNDQFENIIEDGLYFLSGNEPTTAFLENISWICLENKQARAYAQASPEFLSLAQEYASALLWELTEGSEDPDSRDLLADYLLEYARIQTLLDNIDR